MADEPMVTEREAKRREVLARREGYARRVMFEGATEEMARSFAEDEYPLLANPTEEVDDVG